ncbi:MAG: anhydro-N-acetylmuramic acid kinase [Acidobacteriaceae bacterium]
MIVAGLMSGTSADGVDVALVRITEGAKAGIPKLKLLAFESFPYSKKLRTAVLQAMDAASISAAEMARLHWRLGEVYADAVLQTQKRHPKLRIDLIGNHGQTIYHQGKAEKYLGQPLRCTWQLGEASVIAAETRIPVVADFRPADMAVGGQGAPLVPLLDYVLFQHPKRNRVLQNIGGIGNLTLVAAGCRFNDLLAFDTGPGNMLIDAVMQQLYNKPYDRNGAVGRRGKVLQPVLDTLLNDPFFAEAPPKSAGREQYGAAYTEKLIALCRKSSKNPEDVVATATALTAESIRLSYERFVQPRLQTSRTDYVIAGGGARNATLMQMLRDRLEPLGCKLALSDDFGLPTQAKEAVAFALLAWQTWHHLPGNVSSATGATRPILLGKISYA